MASETLSVVGKRTPRKDGVAKVTGREIYPSDVYTPGMLHGVILRSPYAHAEILDVDVSEAEEMGAVCLTFQDIPEKFYNERVHSSPEAAIRDRTILPYKARYVGEPLIAVAAETEELALAALRKIKVKFNELPAAVTVDDALSEVGGAKLYDEVYWGEKLIKIDRNIACERVILEGDIEAGFKEADLIIEDEFETQGQYHLTMETKTAVCKPEANGGLTVWATTQSIHGVRLLLGNLYDIPLSKIDVRRGAIGGGFGSSIHINPVIPICAGLALKAQRPVKLVFSREDDMYDHRKYPVRFNVKFGAKKDGTLVAAQIKAVVDQGAHFVQAYSLLGVLAGWAVSLYKFKNFRFEGKAVYTNKTPACAMQGYGNPQVNFAVESMMDILAEKLKIDPVELRMKNYVGMGDEFWGQGPSIRSIIKSCGVEEMAQKGADLIGWAQRTPPTEKTGDIVRGIGMARGFHTSGTGNPSDESEVIDYSGATIKVNEDGSVDIITGLMDLGGGTWDAAAKIVAETLKMPVEKVGIAPSSTCTSVYDVCTHATRGVYCGCGAIHHVALQVKEKIFEYAAKVLKQNPRDLTLDRNDEIGDAIIYPTGSRKQYITLASLARTAWLKSWGTMSATDSLRQRNCPPCFITNYVEVEVNKKTGQIKVTRAALLSDSGTPINPDMVEGQLIGGLCRGVGYALLEDTVFNSQSGKLTCNGYLTDYKSPSTCEMPKINDIQVAFADTWEPTGPYGAKGIGEAATNAIASAIINAVYNATGVRFHKIPVLPENVIKALKEDCK